MIKYIINTPYGSNIIKENEIIESKDSNLSIIKKICLDNLFTYDGYLKAINKIFNKKHNIPVYVNKKNLFIPLKRVRDYDNIWINYASILTYKSYDKKTLIIFNDYEKMIINLKYDLFKKRVELLSNIIMYKNINI
ncbi:MAG: competence protein ComK [Acholeplasmataceae bacterium]|jgi:hypothetical protein